ncbi:MAG TPA: YsnF/AvaK domain-containing protein [Tepidisphaeraceae bacterium]|nr:YsnF/AvaK domain-containing protein [Tepidisphaeraceae bacterium]
MRQPAIVNVSMEGGIRGTIDTAKWPTDGSKREVMVRLEDGRQVMAPASALQPLPGGDYRLALGTDLRELTAALDQAGGKAVVPVVAEEIAVGKRLVERGRVRVSKVVREEEQTVEVPLTQEEVSVERVRVEQFVESPPQVRQEGDTTIIPLVEEVVVVEKRLMLREEVRVTRTRREVHEPHTVTVREEDVKVERVPAEK